ncbi:hypothetical protein ACLESO_58335, partial [Pyxidicoccus sp. 3LG]
MELVQAFLAGAMRPCAPDEADALARLLEDALARAREAWPGLQLDAADFARHLGERVAPELPLADGLRSLSA